MSIPDSVTSIGGVAFYGCSGLMNVVIGNGVTSIGEWAFYDCNGLTNMTIGNSVTNIGGYAFSSCHGLTSVSIPDSVTSIGDSAFWVCSGLTSVTIPDSVTNIGDSAFFFCSGLKTLSVPGAWEGTDMLAKADVPSRCVVVYRSSDAFPPSRNEAEVASALAGAADGRLGERIRSVEEYDAFRAWIAEKGLDAWAVMGSDHAWISYVLGAEVLFKNEPEIVLGGVSGAKEEGDGVALEVDVTVKDGETAVAVDVATVAAMFEVTSDLCDWGGQPMIPATATPSGSEPPTMKFEVRPDGGTAQKAFLRIRKPQD